MITQYSVLDIIVSFGGDLIHEVASIGEDLGLVYASGGGLSQANVTISAVSIDIVYNTDDLSHVSLAQSRGLVYTTDDLERIEVFGVSGSPATPNVGNLYFAH